MNPIAISAGEPAGIGPELVIKLIQAKLPAKVIVFADKYLLQARADAMQCSLQNKNVIIHHVPCHNIHCLGKPDVANVDYVLQTLTLAANACINKQCAALVTAPIQKSIINAAGIHFSGHTEFLRDLAKVDKTVMLLHSVHLRVALITTHLPLIDVPKAITKTNIIKTIQLLHDGLTQSFAIKNPRIIVCGLNPHAGEEGHLGSEEKEVITPAINELKEAGINVTGPLPADSVFTESYLKNADAIVAMYHDQGLAPFKAKVFHHATNVTLGLPFIRTSVDHGTALDIAREFKADASSLHYAFNLACQLSQQSR